MSRAQGRSTGRRALVALTLLSLLATAYSLPATAAIYRWDNGELITEKDAEPGAHLWEMDLSYADLEHASLSAAWLGRSDLTYAHLMGANLTDASLEDANLTDADLSGANLTDANLVSATLTDADLSGANLTNASLAGTRLTDADLSGAVICGASFWGATSHGFTRRQLYSTFSYQSGDLTGIWLGGNDHTGWDFAGKNLTNASLAGARLTDADLSGAVICGASFWRATSHGFTKEQLYSTASYQSGDLTGIRLGGNDLSGWDFAEKDLSEADFRPHCEYCLTLLTAANFSEASLMDALFKVAAFAGSKLTDADFSRADLRGALGFLPESSTATHSAIWRDGRIENLSLDSRERLTVRDDNGYAPSVSWDPRGPRDPIPITIDSAMGLDPSAALRMVFEDGDWGSTISFEPGIPVSLDGILELTFANGNRPADLVGTTFSLFDWDRVTPTGAFGDVVTKRDAVWDTSNLYTTGEVTLLSAPVLLGDMNLDGAVNGLDVDPFVEVLLSGPYQPEADMNEDQVVNGLDVDPFVTAVVGGTQQIPEPSTLLLCIAAVGVVGGWRKWRG